MKRIKRGICPNCKKEIVRNKPIHLRLIKPIKCNSCGFVIKNPYEIFRK